MKRTYRYNKETKQVEEITDQHQDWINTGVRYGSETLAEMRARNLVPPTDFKEHWAKSEAEKARRYKLAQGDLSQVKKDPKLREKLGRELYRKGLIK